MTLKIIAWTVGILALLIGGILATGALLPRDHVATGARTLALGPEEAAALIENPGAYATWRKDVKISDVHAETDGARWRETSHGHGIDYRLTREGPSRWRSTILTEGLPYGGYWIIEVAPAGTGSTVRITEHGFVDNLAFRTLGRFVFGFDSSLKAYLRDLEAARTPA